MPVSGCPSISNSKEMRHTWPDDLGELLELLRADLDVADFEQTGEKLHEQGGQRLVLIDCVLACRETGLRSRRYHVPSPRSQRSRQ